MKLTTLFLWFGNYFILIFKCKGQNLTDKTSQHLLNRTADTDNRIADTDTARQVTGYSGDKSSKQNAPSTGLIYTASQKMPSKALFTLIFVIKEEKAESEFVFPVSVVFFVFFTRSLFRAFFLRMWCCDPSKP